MGELILEARGLSKQFRTDGGAVDALTDVSLQATRGSVLVLVGPSGCGKTTLLRILAGVESQTGGEIDLHRPEGHTGPIRTLVFQQDGLLPWKRIDQNVAFGLRMRGMDPAARQSRARDALSRFGLSAFASRFPRELSVGMQQRVALLRALLMETPLLLLDEPFASVDAQTRRILQEELLREQRRTGATVVLVTHDVDEALLLADTILVMSGRPGRIIDVIDLRTEKGARLEALGSAPTHLLRTRIWSQIESSVRAALGAA
jgi:NitT/TauT family transport system ATP-binding protein